MKKLIPCLHCGGQCYMEHDGAGAIALKCLQCGRVRRTLSVHNAVRLGIRREHAEAIVFANWSAWPVDTGEGVLDLEDDEAEEVA